MHSEKWILKRRNESVFVNLLLSSISVFYLLCRLAEIWHEPLLAALAMFMAGVMVMCAIAVMLLHDGDEVSPLTSSLVYLCCLVQLLGLLWRICTDELDATVVACHLCTIALMGAIIVYSRYLDRKNYIYL